MKTFKSCSFSEKIRWRIRGLWLLLFCMLAYMVVVGELGWGDTRIITRFAETVGSMMFFGSMGWVIYKIVKNKKLLKSPVLLKNRMYSEADEHAQYIHDKSGGIVWDALFVCLFFITVTTSLVSMPAFYTAFSAFAAAVLLKLTAYFIYSRL